MAATGTIRLEDSSMPNITGRLGQYLNQHRNLEIISISHCMLPNARFSAFIALRDTSARNDMADRALEIPQINQVGSEFQGPADTGM